jgi:hypothetical protein
MPLEQLKALNVEIGEKEAQTDQVYFADLLAPAFVMRRANNPRDIVDRDAWLKALAKAEKKVRSTRITSVSLVGEERAIVTCVVTLEGRDYDNLRIFVRKRDAEASRSHPWLLLAWVNEPLPI